MYELILVCLGIFIGRYLMEFLDQFLNWIINKFSVSASKMQKLINNAFGGNEQTEAIGFRIEDGNEGDYEDDEDFDSNDDECKNNINRIGFRKTDS